MMISPDQIRAARALLRVEQDELARQAHVSAVTVRRLESRHGTERVSPITVERIRQALEILGVEFIENGVRYRLPVHDAAALARDMTEIARRSAARQSSLPPFSEDDLYDENGLPA
jgi:transcriptional regulator with XRE-family HTH domain